MCCQSSSRLESISLPAIAHRPPDMPREIELDELFAYLDQLELNERLEEQQVDVSLGLGQPVTEVDASAEVGTHLQSIPQSAIRTEAVSVAADTKDAQGERAETGSADSTSPSPVQHQSLALMTPVAASPAIEPLEGETSPSTSISPPATPPRRRTVQFDSATPLKTPQRKAPKLVFTPLRPTQSTNQEKSLPDPTQSFKPVFEEVVLSPPDSSFLQSFAHVELEARPSASSIDSVAAETMSEAVRHIASPSVPVEGFNDALDEARNNEYRAESASPDQPTRTPRRPTKKRIVYSSDEESSPPSIRRTKSPASLQEDSEEIQYVGETTMPVKSREGGTLMTPTTPPPKKGRQTRKAAEGVSKFIDAMAHAIGRDSEDEDSDEAGSLDDFIVDDDYVEYEDPEDNAYVLTYSPTTPKLRKAPAPTKSVPVDLTETSDEETTEQGIAAAPTGTRPKPRTRQPPARAIQTPSKNRAEKKSWNESKHHLARQIMDELDELVFERKLVEEWKVFPVWNNKLLTTAGRAHHKRWVQFLCCLTSTNGRPDKADPFW